MIHGRLTTLRAIERDDLDAIWRWANNAEVMYYWAEPYRVVSREELEGRLAGGGFGGVGGSSRWLLIVTQEEGEPIGRIGYNDLDRRNRHAELAIQIGEPSCWGRGYGSDAIVAFLGYLFHELNLHKVWLRTESYNLRAQRAYEKCGFRRDGVFREHSFLGGRYYDTIIMSITEDEFRATHPFVPPIATGTEASTAPEEEQA